jgi:hypothetical protein
LRRVAGAAAGARTPGPGVAAPAPPDPVGAAALPARPTAAPPARGPARAPAPGPAPDRAAPAAPRPGLAGPAARPPRRASRLPSRPRPPSLPHRRSRLPGPTRPRAPRRARRRLPLPYLAGRPARAGRGDGYRSRLTGVPPPRRPAGMDDRWPMRASESGNWAIFSSQALVRRGMALNVTSYRREEPVRGRPSRPPGRDAPRPAGLASGCDEYGAPAGDLRLVRQPRRAQGPAGAGPDLLRPVLPAAGLRGPAAVGRSRPECRSGGSGPVGPSRRSSPGPARPGSRPARGPWPSGPGSANIGRGLPRGWPASAVPADRSRRAAGGPGPEDRCDR